MHSLKDYLARTLAGIQKATDHRTYAPTSHWITSRLSNAKALLSMAREAHDCGALAMDSMGVIDSSKKDQFCIDTSAGIVIWILAPSNSLWFNLHLIRCRVCTIVRILVRNSSCTAAKTTHKWAIDRAVRKRARIKRQKTQSDNHGNSDELNCSALVLTFIVFACVQTQHNFTAS